MIISASADLLVLEQAIAAEQQPRPQPGGTVWIRGGVYPEEVTLRTGGAVDRPLTVRGEKPTINGESPDVGAFEIEFAEDPHKP